MENIVDKQKMEALQALAETNLKVSEVRALLIKLEETEKEYLQGREQRAMERIKEVHAESAELLKETQQNYEGTRDILSSVSEFAEFLKGAYADFRGILDDFDRRNTLWEKNCTTWEAEAKATRDAIKVQQAKIENDKKANKQREQELEATRKQITDLKATLERTISRLKT